MNKSIDSRPLPPEDEIFRRLKSARKQMEARNIDALIIYSGPGCMRFGQRGHVMYMSNYEPSFI